MTKKTILIEEGFRYRIFCDGEKHWLGHPSREQPLYLEECRISEHREKLKRVNP